MRRAHWKQRLIKGVIGIISTLMAVYLGVDNF
jgi:hypothetical protein